MTDKKCGYCANFLGMGDWDLCCKDPPEEDRGVIGHLCYADTPACRKFIPSMKVQNKEGFNHEPTQKEKESQEG